MELTQENVAVLLGRPLSVSETTNFKVYIGNAILALGNILCTDLSQDNGSRYYEARQGYSTVYTGLFDDIFDVKVNGLRADPKDYYPALNGDRNSKVYNSIVFKTRFGREHSLEIDAEWGVCKYPRDLADLVAKQFAIQSQAFTVSGAVSSKKVEDFSINYDTDVTVESKFRKDNATTIAKYSQCGVGYLRSGRVKPRYGYFPYDRRNWRF